LPFGLVNLLPPRVFFFPLLSLTTFCCYTFCVFFFPCRVPARTFLFFWDDLSRRRPVFFVVLPPVSGSFFSHVPRKQLVSVPALSAGLGLCVWGWRSKCIDRCSRLDYVCNPYLSALFFFFNFCRLFLPSGRFFLLA